MRRIRQRKKKLPALDKYVIFSLSSIIIFTIAVLVIFVITQIEPSALVVAFYGVFGGELFLLAMIKRLKLKSGENGKENDAERGYYDD